MKIFDFQDLESDSDYVIIFDLLGVGVGFKFAFVGLGLGV